jgi:hypothetical protein
MIFFVVIPAKARIHLSASKMVEEWIPAFAGTTLSVGISR